MRKMFVITLILFSVMLVSPGLRRAKAQSICILAGSKMFLVPNATDHEFSDLAPDSTWGTSPCPPTNPDTPPYSTQGYLQDRMAYLGLLDYDGPPCLGYPAPSSSYSLHLQSTSTGADYWIIGGIIENWSMPDGSTIVAGTLSIYKPSTGNVIKEYFSRAAYPTYGELFISRKLGDTTTGFSQDVHTICP